MFVLLCFSLAISSCGVFVHGEPILDVAEFTARLQELARDALGKDKIQELMDTEAQFSTRHITVVEGEKLANELASTLSSRFAKYFTAVERISTAAHAAYAANNFQENANYDQNFTECCQLVTDNLEYNGRVFTKTNPDAFCYRVSDDAPDTFTVPASDDMLQVFKMNQVDISTWQYFGTEEGIHLKFPAHLSAECGNYDPRFRPWYVGSSSPVAKDLVLVIDSSGSMADHDRMKIAKEAAITVVETLGPNDRIGLVQFSNTASTPPGTSAQSLCYNSEMAYAIPDNVRYIKSYIQDISAYGQTAYLAAFDKAFNLLNDVNDVPGQTRDKVILFLTDGKPTDSLKENILNKIRDRNGVMANTVTIMTYGLSISENTDDLLAAIARQDNSDESLGDVNVGVFTKIDSVENLRLDLGSYYTHFGNRAALEKPHISVPYVDFSGIGLVSSICDTVLYDGELKGVTCIDARIADIIRDIEYAQTGELSYTFVIDNTGRTLIHPLIPSPFNVDDDPVFIDISELERTPEAEDVFVSMKSGGNGAKTFMTNFTVGMGHSNQHGVMHRQMEATYQWRQVLIVFYFLFLLYII